LQSAYPIRVWNGIFAAGDRRPESDLKTISPNRDRKSETTTREKWPQKKAFLFASYQLRVSEDWVVGTTGIEPVTPTMSR
jgi:hypothetical protein